jgi:hypothetical protein
MFKARLKHLLNPVMKALYVVHGCESFREGVEYLYEKALHLLYLNLIIKSFKLE